VWFIVALLLGGFVLGWIFNKSDFEQVLDLFTVWRECIRNSGHHAPVDAQIEPDPLEHSVSSATAKSF
jgi:hypothetical protein